MLTFKRLGAVAAVAVSLAVPATASAQQDLRNPDRQVPTAPATTQDLRNPDQQVPATPPAAVTQDLRNADRRGPVTVEPIAVPAITTIEAPADGFDWGDAGIGAAGGIAVLAMLAGLTMVGVQHRRGPRVTA